MRSMIGFFDCNISDSSAVRVLYNRESIYSTSHDKALEVKELWKNENMKFFIIHFMIYDTIGWFRILRIPNDVDPVQYEAAHTSEYSPKIEKRLHISVVRSGS